MSFRLISALAALATVAPAMHTADDWDQHWRMKRSRSSDHVHFTIERSRAGSQWTNSTDVPLSRFRNLTEDMLSRSGDARFEYVHDAGRLIATGRFFAGVGSGTWSFAPDPTYVAELRHVGYGTPDTEQLLSLFMHDVSLNFARGVREAGLRASIRDLIQMRVHGVQLEFVRDLRASATTCPFRTLCRCASTASARS